MLRTPRQASQRRRPCPSPRRQRTELLFDEMGWSSLGVFVVPANGTRRIPQYSTAYVERRSPRGVQSWGCTGQWGVLVGGPWTGVCGGRPPLQKINFGHSGIFLNNTSPDPDASLPNPALQRLFDVRVFSSRANENAPASKGSRSNAAAFALCLASSQHAHLFLLLLLLLFVVTDPPPPPLPPPSRSPGSGTPPTARPVAGFRVSSRTSCLVRPFPGWRCWIPNPLLI
jgi:hypothetical protein